MDVLYEGTRQAYVFSVDDNGNIDMSSYSTAGGCAGGAWVVQLSLAPTDACDIVPCDNYVVNQLNEHFTLGEAPSLTEDDITSIQHLFEVNESHSITYVNIADLDPDVYQSLVSLIKK